MKYLILSIAFILIVKIQFAQFTNKAGEEISSCDCNEPVTHLDYTMKLPEKYTEYSYIRFVAYRGDQAISSVFFRPAQIEKEIKLNLLNKNNKGLRTLLGMEYGLFRGEDFNNVSYNSMCDYNGQVKLSIVAFGFSQVGTETTYTLESNKTTIKAKTVPVYDGGVELARGKTIEFVPLKK